MNSECIVHWRRRDRESKRTNGLTETEWVFQNRLENFWFCVPLVYRAGSWHSFERQRYLDDDNNAHDNLSMQNHQHRSSSVGCLKIRIFYCRRPSPSSSLSMSFGDYCHLCLRPIGSFAMAERIGNECDGEMVHCVFVCVCSVRCWIFLFHSPPPSFLIKSDWSSMGAENIETFFCTCRPAYKYKCITNSDYQSSLFCHRVHITAQERTIYFSF